MAVGKEESGEKRRWYNKLRDMYRLVIMDDDTLEERLSFRLTRLNVFIVLGTLSIFLVFITSYIIAFTPLREYIPGYAPLNLEKRLYEMQIRADSLEQNIKDKDVFLKNIKNIVNGQEPSGALAEQKDSARNYDSIRIVPSQEDTELRREVENQDKYNIYRSDMRETVPTYQTTIRNFSFFPPLKGIVTSKFDRRENHLGIDIVSGKNEAIKATLDGTVLFAGWTLETGYVITIQHASNIVSIYKHNAALMKKEGDFVRAGEVIAIIGETGELSTGPHLHFELWYNGTAVNPEDYMSF